MLGLYVELSPQDLREPVKPVEPGRDWIHHAVSPVQATSTEHTLSAQGGLLGPNLLSSWSIQTGCQLGSR